MEEGQLRCRCGVVPFEWLVTRGVDQGIGHVQRRNEVVNAAVLGTSAALTSLHTSKCP